MHSFDATVSAFVLAGFTVSIVALWGYALLRHSGVVHTEVGQSQPAPSIASATSSHPSSSAFKLAGGATGRLYLASGRRESGRELAPVRIAL